MNFWMKAAPTRREPVPERDWTVATWPLARSGEPSPRSRLVVASLKAARPWMGRYSLFSPLSSMIFSAFFTTSSTYGCSSSVLYAPTPRFSLSGDVSA